MAVETRFHLDPLDRASEGIRFARRVVVGNGREVVATDVGVLVAETDRLGSLDASVADLDAVGEQGDGSAFAHPAAVVRELHANLVLAVRNRGVASYVRPVEAEQV